MDWGTFAALVTGSALTVASTAAIEMLRFKLGKEQRRSEHSESFQHQTLIEVRDATVRLAQAAGELWQAQLRKEPVPGDGFTPGPLGLEYRDAHFRLEALRRCVHDSGLRDELGAFDDDAWRVRSGPPTREENEPLDPLKAMDNAFNVVIQHVGVLLGNLDKEESANRISRF